ncbi:hypothetical protein AAG570_008127 [Ranatra chinensis]|uniref:Uncharacterized protein n=1 Tax=Ranatra chinensis TaxID=642074 RepID=A0ABD0YCF0_9HEMI
MTLSKRPQTTDGYIWICPKKLTDGQKCDSSQSIRHDTWFTGSHLDLRAKLALTFEILQRFPRTRIGTDLEVIPTTVTDWTQFVRETVVDYLENHSETMSSEESDGYESAEEGFTSEVPDVHATIPSAEFNKHSSIIEQTSASLEGWELNDDLVMPFEDKARDLVCSPSVESAAISLASNEACIQQKVLDSTQSPPSSSDDNSGIVQPSDEDHTKVESGESSKGHPISSQSNDECTMQSWPSWKSWGVTSILSSATQNVCNLTSNVAQGFGQDAEGLNTLESLGKKTMDVLQEGDPGLKKKRALLFQQDKPILSQVLKEAQERTNQDNSPTSKPIVRDVNFEALFDEMNGLVHLDALQMISQQCNIKIKKFLGECRSVEIKAEYTDTLKKLEEAYTLDNEESDEGIETTSFSLRLCNALTDMDVNTTADKILDASSKLLSGDKKLSDEEKTVSNMHKVAIHSIAEFTALSIELIHRIAENLLNMFRRLDATFSLSDCG